MARREDGTLIFHDYPEFMPNLTPHEIFEQGAFGGTYWRPIKSGITKKSYKNIYLRYFNDIDPALLCDPVCDPSKNKYKVVSGTSLRYWESKGWIVAQDPYGWVQWYCEFYAGRRSPDDRRQIDRWLSFAGPGRGRFRQRIIRMIKAAKKRYNDVSVSPVIRQGLHQWAYTISPTDL